MISNFQLVLHIINENWLFGILTALSSLDKMNVLRHWLKINILLHSSAQYSIYGQNFYPNIRRDHKKIPMTAASMSR